MMNPLRIAVIGGGYWGKKVMHETFDIGKSTGQIELYSVVETSPQSLFACQQELGPGVNYRSDLQGLATDPLLSGVHICTPNGTHFDIASRFLRQGKSVLVEKPLTLKTAEAYELIRLARDNKSVLCVGHIHRFNNGVRELRKVLSEGQIGDPYYVEMRWTAFMNPQLQREVITDLAPHPFDICNYILDLWPDKVSCKGKGYRTKLNEEVAFITAEHKGGIIANIEVSWLDPDKRREVTVVGSNGIAHLDCATQKLTIDGPQGKHEVPVFPSNTLASEIIHFADCIRSNQDAAPFANHSDGLLGARVVSLLEACRESMLQDRTIQVLQPVIPTIQVG
jgi:UDP-N-acetylglucosamine 3-dehydrogenase